MAPEYHAVIHAVNEALGGRDHCFSVTEPAEYRPVDQAASLHDLVADMHAGSVDCLLIIGVDAVFAAPRALGFAEALRRVPFSLAMSVSFDDTGQAARWFVPLAHEFEAWGHARAFDGTANILQPQALPLYEGRSAHEVLALFTGAEEVSSATIMRQAWQQHLDAQGWHDALAAGVIPSTASQKAGVTLQAAVHGTALPAPPSGLVLQCQPDPNLRDGRYANNAWLQELPRPLTKLTWNNPLLVSPEFAQREALVNGAEVRATIGGVSVDVPVYVVPGQAPDVAVALLGYRRKQVGTVGAGTGFDLVPLRDAAGTLSLQKTGRQIPLASTDHHNPLGVSLTITSAI